MCVVVCFCGFIGSYAASFCVHFTLCFFDSLFRMYTLSTCTLTMFRCKFRFGFTTVVCEPLFSSGALTPHPSHTLYNCCVSAVFAIFNCAGLAAPHNVVRSRIFDLYNLPSFYSVVFR